MNVVVVGGGLVKVNDVADVFDINTPGGDVGGNKDVDVVILELAEDVFALILAFVAMDGPGFETGFDEIAAQVFDAVFGATENENLAELIFTKQAAEKINFLGFPGSSDDVLTDITRGGAGFHRNLFRATHKLTGNLFNFIIDGSREKQGLTFLGEQREQESNVFDKTHIKHPVNFVENHGFGSV